MREIIDTEHPKTAKRITVVQWHPLSATACDSTPRHGLLTGGKMLEKGWQRCAISNHVATPSCGGSVYGLIIQRHRVYFVAVPRPSGSRLPVLMGVICSFL
jgi:hypothetical protein